MIAASSSSPSSPSSASIYAELIKACNKCVRTEYKRYTTSDSAHATRYACVLDFMTKLYLPAQGNGDEMENAYIGSVHALEYYLW